MLSIMLRSDAPRGDYARARLAEYIAVKPRLKRGRKPDLLVIEVAEVIEECKQTVRANGHKIYNFSDPDRKMPNKPSHDQIVDFIFKDRAKKGLQNPEIDALNHYLKRARNSRAKKSV